MRFDELLGWNAGSSSPSRCRSLRSRSWQIHLRRCH